MNSTTGNDGKSNSQDMNAGDGTTNKSALGHRQEYGIMGAVIGDVCGSIYEYRNRKTDDPRSINLIKVKCDFTDDSILTVATMHACLDGGWTGKNFSGLCGKRYLEYGRKYPHPLGSYGGGFINWLNDGKMKPYNSWGNGSAMRASPVGWLGGAGGASLDTVMELAKATAIPTHNHPEGIKGAQAVAAAVYLARDTGDKAAVKSYVENTFGYDLSAKLDDIRRTYTFDVSCQGTVPVAIIAFLESEDFRHAIQLAISVGGDTDTLACITGAVAGAYYKDVPEDLLQFVCFKAREFGRTIEDFVRQAKVAVDLSRFLNPAAEKLEKLRLLYGSNSDR